MRDWQLHRDENGDVSKMTLALPTSVVYEDFSTSEDYRDFLSKLRLTRGLWDVFSPDYVCCGGHDLIRLRQDCEVCPLTGMGIEWETMNESYRTRWFSWVRAAADGHDHPDSAWYHKRASDRAVVVAVRRDLIEACGLDDPSMIPSRVDHARGRR